MLSQDTPDGKLYRLIAFEISCYAIRGIEVYGKRADMFEEHMRYMVEVRRTTCPDRIVKGGLIKDVAKPNIYRWKDGLLRQRRVSVLIEVI